MDDMIKIDKNNVFLLVTVFKEPMLFLFGRVNRKSVPDNLYVYEVMFENPDDILDDPENQPPVRVMKRVDKNHLYGTLLSRSKIPMEHKNKENRYYRDIEWDCGYSDDWIDSWEILTVGEFLGEYVNQYSVQQMSEHVIDDLIEHKSITIDEEDGKLMWVADDYCGAGFEYAIIRTGLIHIVDGRLVSSSVISTVSGEIEHRKVSKSKTPYNVGDLVKNMQMADKHGKYILGYDDSIFDDYLDSL